MSLLNNNRKTNLLFRQFIGTANALLPENSNFTNEPLKNINYVFNSEIQNQEVPLSLPSNLRISALDICNNIASDSSFNLAAYGYPQLTFFKNIPLDPVPGAASQVWFKYIDPSANPLTNQSNNLLRGMIPFKFDDINVLDPTYLPIVKRNFATPPSTNFVNVGAPNNTPLYWIQNSANGLIQFYATTTVLNSNNIQDITSGGIQDYTKAPKLSFYRYTGTYGAGGGGGGGGSGTIGVSDFSNNNYGPIQDISEIFLDTDSGFDLSFTGNNRVIITNTGAPDLTEIETSIDKLNRMILPDGYVDISGTNYDLCGNEVVRTYYTYNRDKMYIGYDNLPILDGSAVDHTGDPSFNSINDPQIILTISGNTFMSGSLIQGFFDPPNITGYQGVSGECSHAEGYRTWVGGDYAHVEGNACKIGPYFSNSGVGHYSHAEGDSNEIYTLFSHAEGRSNVIQGTSNWSHIEGHDNLIDSNSSYVHAEGRNNIVSSNSLYSHIEGSGNNIISAESSHAEGASNTIRGSFSHAEGYNNTIDISALCSHIEGSGNQVFSIASHAEGTLTTASGDYSHAEGDRTIASGVGSHSEGVDNSAIGQYCHVEGRGNIVNSTIGHSEGSGNIINLVGIGSHAEGLRNDISGTYCHAEGFNNNIGENSAHCHAEGISNNIPLGTGSHIEGTGNLIEVTQFSAHVEGGFNRIGSLGSYAHAEGFGTIIDTSGGHATGHYNDISQNVIFVIGCGKSNINRMDALYVDTSCITHINNTLEVSGNVDISGDVNIDGDLDISGDVNIDGDLDISGDINIDGYLDISGDVNIDGNLYVDGIIESIDGTRFVDYKNFSNDISGSVMGVGNTEWFCIAKIDPGPAGETANGLFVLDDDTSGLRQTIVFRAGSSYSRGNFIDVISNNYYGQRIYDIRIDISGSSYYAGANLYINRGYTTNPSRIFVRVYQNKRKGNPSDGTNIGYWELTSTPLIGLDQTIAQINLQFNPGGMVTGNKATTLDTLIDAQLKVTGDIAALGDISMNGGQITYIADATDNSGVPSWGQVQSIVNGVSGNLWTLIGNDIYYNAGDVIVSNTNLIQEVTLNPFMLPPLLPQATFASLIIASVVKTYAITTGYFTMQLTIPNYEQIIHFIAGVIDNKSPFIKVISNTNSDFLNGCSNLYIVDDGNDYFLCTDFLYAGGTQVDYIKIVLSNNSQNYSAPLSNNINWILKDLLELPVGPTYTSHVDVSLNLIGGGPYAITSLYEIIDNSFQVNKDLILLENQYIKGDIISTDPSGVLDISATIVDISGALEVNSYVNIKGEPSNSGGFSLDVCGNSLFSGKVIVDLSGGSNDGITIINRGSGGPQLKFEDNNTTFLGTTTYKNIYVDGITDDLNMDIGSDDLFVNMGNSTLSSFKVRQSSGGTTIIGVEKGNSNINLFQTANRGGLELNNIGVTGEGLRFQCTTTTPEHIWYIGSTSLSSNGHAIIVKGLTEVSNFFQSGEVVINYYSEDIDFAVGTTDTSHAFFVDAGLNIININSPIYINENLSISGDIYSNSNIELSGNLIVYGNGTINQDLSVNGVTTLSDLSFSDYLNNVARLPSETIIPFRKHQTSSGTPYRDLKVDGYSEYSITTDNLSTTNSQEDWVTIGRVGFQDMINQSQRADGLFEITCNNSGSHQTIRLEASHHYKKGQTLDVVKNITYGLSSNRHIKAVRMAYASIYDGGILQIQISQNTSSTSYTLSEITIKLYYNNNYFGWTSDLSNPSAPTADNTPLGYSQSGYPGTGNTLWDGSTYSNFTLFYPSIEGIDLTERIVAAGNPGQSVLNYTSDMILNKVYMKDDLDLSGNGISNIGSIITNHLLVESSGGSLLFEVEHTNNTAKFGLPLELQRDSITNMSSQLSNYSIGIANNIGNSSSATEQIDGLIWKPSVGNSISSKILINEQYMHLYSRDLAGDSQYGGLTGFSKGSSITNNGYSYFPYSNNFAPAASYARLGLMPTSSSTAHTIDRPITSYLHLMKKIWITGVYINTPFCPRPTQTGNIFQWGSNAYVDLEIRSGTGASDFDKVHRIGNPNSGNAQTYFFPSSTSIIDSNGGVRVTFPANEWKFVDAGTNMNDIVRLNFFIGNANTNSIFIINESTDGARDAEIDGYITYVQEYPLAM